MKLDDHITKLGRLIVNLHSLEFILRVFLHKLPGSAPLGIPHGSCVYTKAVGEELPESRITGYESLGELIEEYNEAVNSIKGTAPIDKGLVDLRDAIAHGRVSAAMPDESPLRLIKFSRPSKGKVKVTFNQEMNEAWFTSETKRALEAIETVQRAIGVLEESKRAMGARHNQ